VKKKKKDRGGKSGKTVDFGRYLRGLNRNLDKAKEAAASGGYEEFDDGRYEMRCVDAKIGISKNKRVQAVLTWKFLNGDYKGKEKLDFEGLTEDHLEYLLRKLDAMGYDTAEIEDLESDLNKIFADIKKEKPKCRVRIKTKGEFQNVYVDGPLDEESGDEDEEDEEDEEEDEEEKPKKGKGKKSKKKDEDDDEEEEDEEEEDEDEEESGDEEADDDEEDEEEDEDEEEEKPKKKGKKKSKKDEDEDEEEEEEDEEDDEEEEVEDEVDIVVGSIVKATSKKEGKVKGEVIELFEGDGKVLIKTDKGKTLKLKAEQITSVEESPAKSVPKKKKKSKK
jgi:hypothetical protein